MIDEKMKYTIEKIERKLWEKIVSRFKQTPVYPYIYKSYWHYLFSKKKVAETGNTLYFTARPNRGAGIGHQLANWISGYWWAKQFDLKFAHLPFSPKKWENFFAFGSKEKSVDELLKDGYKVRRIPLFNEDEPNEIEFIRKIIATHNGTKTVILCEQDQHYRGQYGVMADIQNKFYKADARKKEQVTFLKDCYNVAIHVRRGDILADLSSPGMAKRYLDNEYFVRVLKKVLTGINTVKPIHVYFFSQGKMEDFKEFHAIPNIHWCLDMDVENSFLHFIYADVLITSKSSFSYKPALLNKSGIKVCPENFWHDYPKTDDFILVNDEGNFDIEKLKNYNNERK
ncbi:hypothetical protein [Mucilaginibacter sp. HD30]